MRKRQGRSRFPSWVEDGVIHSSSEVFLDPLSPLCGHGPCLDLASPPLLWPHPLVSSEGLFYFLSLSSGLTWGWLKVRPGPCKIPQGSPITRCWGLVWDGALCPCSLAPNTDPKRVDFLFLVLPKAQPEGVLG